MKRRDRLVVFRSNDSVFPVRVVVVEDGEEPDADVSRDIPTRVPGVYARDPVRFEISDVDSGDVTLEVAQKRAENFEVGLIRVEDYFEGTPIRALAGPPPEPDRTDYCWGGCPGALEEAIRILEEVLEKHGEGLHPKHHSACHYNLGVAYMRLGRESRAVREFNDTIDAWPLSLYAKGASAALERRRSTGRLMTEKGAEGEEQDKPGGERAF